MSMSVRKTQEQDGETPQNDQRLLLADDLKEAQGHIQVELRNKLKTTDQISLHQSTRYRMKNQRLQVEHKINQKIVELNEAGVLHVNWTSLGHCVSRRGNSVVFIARTGQRLLWTALTVPDISEGRPAYQGAAPR
ncbi:hypothetical protein Tco_0204903 [Tanacetum coccineum]